MRKSFLQKGLIQSSVVFRRQPLILICNLVGRLWEKKFDNLTTLCFFIGHKRSGHTVLGSILDAHPHVAIATEAHLLDLVNQKGIRRSGLFAFLYLWSKFVATFLKNRSAGYSYKVNSEHQGRSIDLKVIGDNKGKGTLLALKEQPNLIEELQKLAQLKLKVIYSVRNPFDIISTQYLKRLGRQTKLDEEYLKKRIEIYQEQTIWIKEMMDEKKLDIHLIHHEILVEQPKERIRQALAFLGLSVEESYLENTSSIIIKSPNQSRFKIDWPEHLIIEVEKHCQSISFLNKYSFRD